MNSLTVICFIILSVVTVYSMASPVDLAEQETPSVNALQVEQYDVTHEERADRHRRVTCDLLSINTKYGSLNHAACAAHCLAMRRGYRGGRCINGVCNCRR